MRPREKRRALIGKWFPLLFTELIKQRASRGEDDRPDDLQIKTA